MDQDQSETPTFQQPSSQATPTFPSDRRPSGSKKVILWLLVLVLVAGLVIGWFVLRGQNTNQGTSSSPSPTVGGTTAPPVPTPAPVDKSKVKIKALNGTNIGGEAAYLQGKLRELGYTNIELGNESRDDINTTVVTYATDLSKSVVDEITKKLEELYKDVDTKTSGNLKDVDVQIVTGLRKGQTPKPSPTATPTPSATPTTSPSPSPTGQ